ncbi:short-chain dehydrogenase [Melanomma pulvis-pyrius CBS 109.77]|uniref:Short-chain dehydrogenase n=1 Tax=Melanomma pulvis-pyrius CBS 109.77 TaxID=1314802 RepID=A0A6A6XQF6_9PLEO|nr:short-chain dehydrogenase [Melanomma pulvis-pyrius CBS 109.77]
MTDHHEIVRKDKWDMSSLPSLTGKTAIVTGANSPDGIGYNVAYQLFLKGAKVFVSARSLEKANSAIKIMASSSPSSDTSLLKPLVMDLGDFKGVKRVAEKFLAEEERLDIVVNNAASTTLTKASDVDANGISPGFGINHLGPFLLTTTLIPLLIKTAKINPDVRIVTMSSTAHYDVPESVARFDSLSAFNEGFETPRSTADEGPLAAFGDTFGTDIGDIQSIFIRYGYAKLANVLFAKELQRRLDAQGVPILSLSVHPGAVGTNGAAAFLGGRDTEIFKQSISPADGGITPLFAAAHPEPREQVERYKGGFVMPWGGLKEPSALARDERNAKQLWETSERVLEGVLKV